MNVNIKEIFKTDLDPNSSIWWSKDKLDKLNFNFYQFINGGMPGPQGTIGPDGDYGYMGPKGHQGFLGSQGYIGETGPASPSEWIQWTPVDANIPKYLFPKVRQAIGFVEQLPVVLKTGYLNPLLELPEDYLGAVKTVFSSPVTGATVPSQQMIGLRLQHESKAADFRLKLTASGILNPPNFLDMEIGRIVSGDPGFDLLNMSDEIIYEISGTSYLKITDSLVTLGGNNLTNINVNKAYSHNAFMFNQSAIAGNVLISEGTNGKAKWVEKKTVFGSFPIGSIISIRPEDFNSTNFHLAETIVQPGGPSFAELQIIHGKGKIGGEYEGWYLCNGETWKVANGVNEFPTPNLSSFNYMIQGNTGGQNALTSGDDSPIIIGGGNINMVSTTNNLGNYQINMTLDNSDEVLEVVPQVTNTTSASRMIHIVFLDLTDLHWSNTSTPPPPPTTQDIFLKMASFPKPACLDVPDTWYSWTGTSTAEWSTFNYLTTTRYLYNHGTTTFAPAGWYGNTGTITGGIVRYWNGTQFTSIFACPLSIATSVDLIYGITVSSVNGEILPGDGQSYVIDGFDWFDATSLEFNGAIAPEGWYRETTTGIRRYWNGVNDGFLGVNLTANYVMSLNNILFSTTTAQLACVAVGSMRSTYIEHSMLVYSSNLSDYEGFVLYVNLAWAGGTAGIGPLMTAVSMNAPSSSVKYKSAFKNSYTINGNVYNIRNTGTINQTTGVITGISNCP
jgi:hypothetical protein